MSPLRPSPQSSIILFRARQRRQEPLDSNKGVVHRVQEIVVVITSAAAGKPASFSTLACFYWGCRLFFIWFRAERCCGQLLPLCADACRAFGGPGGPSDLCASGGGDPGASAPFSPGSPQAIVLPDSPGAGGHDPAAGAVDQ